MDDIFRALRQAVNAAVHDPVVGIVNDRIRVLNGLQIYFIRFSIQRKAHLVIAGKDRINLYVRPGGDDPFHPLAIYSTNHFAIIIGDQKGIVAPKVVSSNDGRSNPHDAPIWFRFQEQERPYIPAIISYS